MKTTVLFTGYAPVHFLCFRPILEQLRRLPSVGVFFSGGIRRDSGIGFSYNGPALYRQFGLPPDRILPVEEIQDRDFDVLFSANKRLILPPRNVGNKVQIFHGVSFRNRGVRRENLAYDHFFLIGPYMRRKFEDAGFLNRNDPRGVPVGFPKTDPLLSRQFDRRAWLKHYGFGGQRPVILYAPTGEANNSLETMGQEIIARIGASGRYDLLVKPHDHPKVSTTDWFAKLGTLESEHTRVVRDLDVIPMLRLADLLITDASSVANEFTLLNRPIIFIDVPELFEHSRRTGALLDLKTWGRRGGIVLQNPEDIAHALADSLAHPDRAAEVRRAIAQDLFYNSGHAAQAAVNWFTEQALHAGR